MKTIFKTIAIINSCQTIKQLKTAKNVVYNYSMLRPECCANECFNELIYDRFNEIRKERKNEKIHS
jgi:hypothetical protein